MSGTVADNINRQSGVIAEPSGAPEVRSDDPAASVGVVWFNTTSGVLKVYRTIGIWVSGGSLSVDFDLAAGCGTQGAAMGCGPNTDTDGTQLYNGSAWSASGNMNTGRYWLSCFGTQTAGVSCGGWDGGLGDTTEEFNGASWASGMEDLATARYNGASAGTQTAGLYFGGSNST